MKYCSICGKELTVKLDDENIEIPYCETCSKFYYPSFNSGVSMVVFNPTKDKILLVKQSGQNDYVLIAGYISKGENANETIVRELFEETSMEVKSMNYNDNRYFEPSNTLMHNYMVVVRGEEFKLSNELGQATWFSLEDAIVNIKPGSLAKEFLLLAMHKTNNSNLLIEQENDRFAIKDNKDNVVAFITIEKENDYYLVAHTFVDPSLRGLSIANVLMERVFDKAKNDNMKIKPTCWFANKWLLDHKLDNYITK